MGNGDVSAPCRYELHEMCPWGPCACDCHVHADRVADAAEEDCVPVRPDLRRVRAVSGTEVSAAPAWTKVPPGKLPAAVLEQGEWWVNGQGEAIRLADMDERYRRTVAAFLGRKGERLRWSWMVLQTRRFAPHTDNYGNMDAAFDEFIDYEMDRPFVEWLNDRPLVKALLA